MIKLGAGMAPAGTSIAGYGQPATTDRVLKQPFLAVDGTVLNARSIDPKTRDYVLDSSGRSLGMTSTEQQVYLATITTKGTSADSNMGTTINSIQVVRKNTSTEVEATVRASLQGLTSSGKIVIDSIDVSVSGGNLSIKIVWHDTSGTFTTVLPAAQRV